MTNSKEIICLNVGQAGVQISNSCWELFCIEHKLDCEGNSRVETSGTRDSDSFVSNLSTFFYHSKDGNYVPRSISIDMEPSVIDEIRTGAYRHLWSPTCLINGMEDASSNFGRGYITLGKRMIATFMTALTKLIQDCDKLHGIIFLHSYAGGTGSGFTNLILDYIRDEYSKTTTLTNVIVPSPRQSSSAVEPYNCILAAATSLNSVDIALLSDNECIYELCQKKLKIEYPSHRNVNRLLSQLYSSLTVTLRFGSSLDHDIVHLQTNLIPFPRLHFPISTFTPMGNETKIDHEITTIKEITHSLFDDDNRFISCDISQGKYMACCLLYRGLVKPSDVNLALIEIKRRRDIVFVDWSPVGFKIGISPMPPANVAQGDLGQTNINCSMFFNSTAIEQVWDSIHSKYKVLFRKKAFLHWFIGEGMEELEFVSSDEDICRLQSDYREIARQDDEMMADKYGSSKQLITSEEILFGQSSNECPETPKNTETGSENSAHMPRIIEDVENESNNNFVTNNNSLLNDNSNSTYHSEKSLYCIDKVNITTKSNKSCDILDKNRKLLKLFQLSSK